MKDLTSIFLDPRIFVFALVIVVVIFIVKKHEVTWASWPLNNNYKSIEFTYEYIEGSSSYTYTWMPYPGATAYIAQVYPYENLIARLRRPADTEFVSSRLMLGKNELSVVSNYNEEFFRVTAVTPRGNIYMYFAPCFLAGSMVQLFDGNLRAIEDIQVGDMVRGAFGECNEVLALHRPKLGNFKLCSINQEHTTTNHHPHVGPNKDFYCGDPELVIQSTYNKVHTVLGKNGPEERLLHGLQPSRIRKLEVGTCLQTLTGPKTVETLEVFEMPPDTQLYNLVVSNSHTYFVEGYAVTGWPREDDFDYDTWTPRDV